MGLYFIRSHGSNCMTNTSKDDNSVSASQQAVATTFSELKLPEPLLKATDELGFSNCTEIQGLSLPAISNGHDIAAQAQTGTGKTLSLIHI